MKKFIQHLRVYIFRGILAIIPIFLSLLAIQLLYVLIDKKVMVLLGKFIEVRQIPGLGLLLVLVCLYLIGMIVSNIAGRGLFRFIDWIGQGIPVIKAVYHAGKQLSESLSGAEAKQTFKKPLLIDWNDNGVWAIAFVAGQIVDQRTGENLYRVFMPHVPNPATGFIFLVKESQTIDPGWTMEEAIKMVISGGVISPKEIKK
ncbi:MAG: DUF502 domain-containing protein [Candidatus Omnitrophica bacterium]|nr:DUF502 domain-containing protein [Candidatus Omnitrophota bacterium]